MGKEIKEHELDPELENGPIENRSCRDILCCLLFLAAVVAMFVIGIYGYTQGDPSRLARPYDSDGFFSFFFLRELKNIFIRKLLWG
jgi:choline transporter-like protein 2/4/5